jgi:hypothetical protein
MLKFANSRFSLRPRFEGVDPKETWWGTSSPLGEASQASSGQEGLRRWKPPGSSPETEKQLTTATVMMRIRWTRRSCRGRWQCPLPLHDGKDGHSRRSPSTKPGVTRGTEPRDCNWGSGQRNRAVLTKKMADIYRVSWSLDQSLGRTNGGATIQAGPGLPTGSISHRRRRFGRMRSHWERQVLPSDLEMHSMRA